MGYAKVWEKVYMYVHMKVQEKNRDTWRSQGIEKMGDEHMKAHKKKKMKWNDSHVSK